MDKKKKPLFCELDLYFAVLCLCTLIVITFAGVAFRYVLSRPITWLEEVQLILLLWIGFVSGGAAFRKGSHVAIEMVVELFPARLQRVVEWIDRVVVMAILCFLTKECWGYFLLFVRNGRKTPVLRIPYSFVYALMPLTCLLMVSGFLWREYQEEKSRRMPPEKREEPVI